MATPDDRRIEEWVEALAGRTPPQADDARVRDAVSGHAATQAPPAEAPGAEDHAWQQLRFRLRREKLLRAPAQATRWAVAAMVVLAAGAVFWSWQGTQPEDLGIAVAQGEMPLLRGGQPQEFAVASPRDVARRIGRQLADAKARPLAYVAASAITIDFDWDPAAQPDLERTLQHEFPTLRLQPGANRIVLRAAR